MSERSGGIGIGIIIFWIAVIYLWNMGGEEKKEVSVKNNKPSITIIEEQKDKLGEAVTKLNKAVQKAMEIEVKEKKEEVKKELKPSEKTPNESEGKEQFKRL